MHTQTSTYNKHRSHCIPNQKEYKSLWIIKFLLIQWSITLTITNTRCHPEWNDGQSWEATGFTANSCTNCVLASRGGEWGTFMQTTLWVSEATTCTTTHDGPMRGCLTEKPEWHPSQITVLKLTVKIHFLLSSAEPTPPQTQQIKPCCMWCQLSKKLDKLILVRHYSLVSKRSLSHLFTQRA